MLLGSQRRSSPLVCSLLGRCHGDRAWQKNTSMLQLCSMSAQRAISLPWMLLCLSNRVLGEVLLVAFGGVSQGGCVVILGSCPLLDG